MVFMITKHFPGDQAFVRGQPATAELTKPSPPQPQPPLECPRCGSMNTKFCYYNNYNKSQPRHFCKSCKRHWTKGGTLRNIPAGRRRTNKRPRTSTTVAAKAEPQQKQNFENVLFLSTDQKNMSNILHQALIQSSSPSTSIFQSTILESSGTTQGLNAAAPRNHPNTEFSFSSLTYQSSNPDSAEESTVTTSGPPPWTAATDLWSWNDEMGLLGSSSGDLNTVWDGLTFLEGSYPR